MIVVQDIISFIAGVIAIPVAIVEAFFNAIAVAAVG